MDSELKNKRLVYWGGNHNTIVPKMEESGEREVELQGRIFELEEKIRKAKGKNNKEYLDAVKQKKQAELELNSIRKKGLEDDMAKLGLQSKLSEMQSNFLNIQKEVDKNGKKTNTNLAYATQEFYKQGFASQKNLKLRVDFASIATSITDNTKIQSDLTEKAGGAMQRMAAAGYDTAGNMAGLVDSQHRNLDISKQLHTSYKDIGTSGFRDLTEDAKKQAEEARRLNEFRLVERKAMTEQIKELQAKKKLTEKEKTDLADLVATRKASQVASKEQLETAEANVETAERFKIMNQQASAAADLITGPFESVKGVMESLPFGKFISSFGGLDDSIKTFKDGVTKSFKGFMDEENTIGRTGAKGLFNAVSTSADKLIRDIQEGFKRLPGIFKTVNGAVNGMLGPLALIVGSILLATKMVKMFYGGMLETRKEFGLTFKEAANLQNLLNTTAMEFKFMGVSAEDVKAGAQGIMDNLGGIGQVNKENLTAFAQMNATLGISGENAGTLAVNMMAVGVSSMEAVNSQLQSVAALAQAGGVAPASVMNDVAQNSDKFAEFAKDGGENVFRAAIGARQLGVNMATVAGSADALLDFESSIQDQMEAQMLTGKMINTDKARELALAGDLEGMQKEIVSQIGSQAEFDKMNVVQRQAMAKAFGVSVQDLAKMVANQEKLNNMTEAQKSRQDMIAVVMEKINKAGVAFLSAMKSVIPFVGAILSPLLILGGVIAGVVISIGKLVSFFNEAQVFGVGLGDALMFLAGIFTLLTFRTRLLNMTIDIKNKTTIKEFILGKKKATMTLLQAKLEKRGIATKQMSIALAKKEIGLTIRETATAKLRNLQRMLGTKVAIGGNKLKMKTIAIEIKKMVTEKASMLLESLRNKVMKSSIMTKLKDLGLKTKEIALEKLKQIGQLKTIAMDKAKLAGEKIALVFARLKNSQALINLKTMALESLAKVKDIAMMGAQAAGRIGLAAATVAMTVATKIAAGATFLFNAALTANPIGLVVMGVVALIAGIALLVKKFGLMKVVGSILKLAFFPLFGVIGTFKLIGSAISGISSLFSNFGNAVKSALDIAFAPFFLAYKIFQKAKNFIAGFFGGGEEGGEESASPSITPQSNAGKGGRLRQTVTETTIRNGQVVESKSQTKEITTRLDKLNSTGRENVDASKQGASQTRRLNSSIATG